ncbi:MAG: class I SAM-dependent methyltransferase [Ignavibacteriales bacterium]|nr:MAG: class I SAM-dependent methyltransferase [Ignavibacteriales bacterium]
MFRGHSEGRKQAPKRRPGSVVLPERPQEGQRMTPDFFKKIPKSQSDLLLNHWGYDVMEEYTEMISGAGFPDGCQILDVATGTGRAVSILVRLGYRVVTGDISFDGKHDADKRVTPMYYHRVQYVKLNLEQAPFGDDSVRNIVCMNTLHELENPNACLDEIFRIHSPNGTLLIADFNAEGMDIMDKLHIIKFGERHPKGKSSLRELECWLKSRYTNIREFHTRMNRGFIVTGKKDPSAEPLQDG